MAEKNGKPKFSDYDANFFKAVKGAGLLEKGPNKPDNPNKNLRPTKSVENLNQEQALEAARSNLTKDKPQSVSEPIESNIRNVAASEKENKLTWELGLAQIKYKNQDRAFEFGKDGNLLVMGVFDGRPAGNQDVNRFLDEAVAITGVEYEKFRTGVKEDGSPYIRKVFFENTNSKVRSERNSAKGFGMLKKYNKETTATVAVLILDNKGELDGASLSDTDIFIYFNKERKVRKITTSNGAEGFGSRSKFFDLTKHYILDEGDMVFVASDGMNRSEDQLTKIITANEGEQARALAEKIAEESQNSLAPNKERDDITVVLAKIKKV